MVADAIVLAGGLGTRLRSVTGGLIPKVLVPVVGRPFIDYKIRSLAQMGVTRVVLLVGDGASQVEDHVGDGRRLGIEVDYWRDGPTLLGTAGAIRSAMHLLHEHFWVTYGDSIGVGNLPAIEDSVHAAGATGAMTVLENVDKWDRSNVDVRDGFVSAYKTPTPRDGFRWIDYGLLYLSRTSFEPVPPEEPTDLGTVVHGLIERGELLAAPVVERFWEVGSPAALAEVENHFRDIDMWGRLS
jgi:NDP-sugar pyrophosphorylase family protein